MQALDNIRRQKAEVVSAERLRDIDVLCEYAMTSQTFLNKWAATLAGNDPILFDQLQFFANLAMMAKAKVINNMAER
jgi:hypothetical protein